MERGCLMGGRPCCLRDVLAVHLAATWTMRLGPKVSGFQVTGSRCRATTCSGTFHLEGRIPGSQYCIFIHSKIKKS